MDLSANLNTILATAREETAPADYYAAVYAEDHDGKNPGTRFFKTLTEARQEFRRLTWGLVILFEIPEGAPLPEWASEGHWTQEDDVPEGAVEVSRALLGDPDDSTSDDPWNLSLLRGWKNTWYPRDCWYDLRAWQDENERPHRVSRW